MRVLVFSLLFVCSGSVNAVKNVTVDDTNFGIRYSDGWNIPTSKNSLDFNGFHHVTGIRTSNASYSFTGVAVYFLSPKWPYRVGAQLSVDSSSPVTVDLRDYSRPFDRTQGPETVEFDAVWGVSGLENSQHTLFISFAPNSDWLVVDGLTYTEEDSEDPTSSSSTETEETNVPPSIIETPLSPSSANTNAMAIGLGVGVSVSGVGLLLAAFLFFCRRNDEERFDSPKRSWYAINDSSISGPMAVYTDAGAPSLIVNSFDSSELKGQPIESISYNPHIQTILTYDVHRHQQTISQKHFSFDEKVQNSESSSSSDVESTLEQSAGRSK